MIQIAQPEIAAEEIAAVNEVLKSGIIAQGKKVAELEQDFAAYCGTKHAVAVNSGTAAIHAALHAAGVGPGDEVITVPFSFIATINPILMVGAKPVIVDINPDTFCIDTSAIETAVTPKTKAIIPVHLYGQPADVSEIAAVAEKHGLAIIEDACQAIGADYKGRKTGSLGTAGCFSLYATKNIMCGEGGMVTTDSDDVAAAIRRFRQHGMSAPYVYDELGYNYRLTDLQAAIAVEQLKKADRFTEARQANARIYDDELAGIDGLVLPVTAPGRTHVYHQYTIRLADGFPVPRDEFITRLAQNEIGAGIYYPRALHEYPHIAALGYALGDFPVAEQAAREVVSLPVHPHVSADDAAKVVSVIRDIAGA